MALITGTTNFDFDEITKACIQKIAYESALLRQEMMLNTAITKRAMGSFQSTVFYGMPKGYADKETICRLTRLTR